MDDEPLALTLAESQERARIVAVSSYVVDLDLTRGSEVFGSRTVVRFSCSSIGSTSFVEVRPARLVSATLNGRPLENARLTANRLTLEDLRADNELVVEADIPYSSTGEGMHRFVDPLDAETYVGAYLGVDNAQRVFANFDQPDLKAPITATVTAPPGWTVVSNSLGQPVASSSSTGAAGRWAFAPTPPLSTYLFVVVAGPLHSVRAEHRGTPFALHCRQSLAPHLDVEAEEIFGITYGCFDRYAAAWEAMFSRGRDADTLSTYLVQATAQVFWQPEQQALLAPFVDRYFPAAVEVAARRGAAVAAAVGATGFPFHVVDEATLRAGERCLLEGAGTAALRRELADQLDELRRALLVRSLHPWHQKQVAVLLLQRATGVQPADGRPLGRLICMA